MHCLSRFTGLLFLACAFLPADAAEPVKVGVVGMDNYQAVAYAQLLNSPKAEGDLAGTKVVAAFPGEPSPHIAESAVNLPKWVAQIQKFDVKIVETMDDVLKQVDAVMIMSLDPRVHVEQAKAVLKAKKPLYIGRPMALSLTDALEIFRIAKENNTPCWSSSQHRFSPGFSGMKNHPEVGAVIGCDVYGGCALDATQPQLFWHALHSVETLNTILGSGCESVTCFSTPTAESITGLWSDGRVGTYRGIKKGAVKYSATVFGDKGVSTAGIYGHGVPVLGVVPTKDKYMGYEGIAIEMAKFFKGGPLPVSEAETLEVFAFLEAAEQSKARGGAPVKLADVLAQARKASK